MRLRSKSAGPSRQVQVGSGGYGLIPQLDHVVYAGPIKVKASKGKDHSSQFCRDESKQVKALSLSKQRVSWSKASFLHTFIPVVRFIPVQCSHALAAFCKEQYTGEKGREEEKKMYTIGYIARGRNANYCTMKNRHDLVDAGYDKKRKSTRKSTEKKRQTPRV